MSMLLVGDGSAGNTYHAIDPDEASETEFESIVLKALQHIYADYHCFRFTGGFEFEGSVSRPDLAVVAKDHSHWFVIEVELITHSLHGHVLPQLRAFRYGRPLLDCAGQISRAIGLSIEEVKTLVLAVPRTVVVIVNRRSRDWEIACRSVDTQMLTLLAFRSGNGVTALEIEGKLVSLKSHLGFGQYIAIDRCIRFPASVKLPDGDIMVDDESGVGSIWNVTRHSNFAWVVKKRGTPDIPDEMHVQVLQMHHGRISIRWTYSS